MKKIIYRFYLIGFVFALSLSCNAKKAYSIASPSKNNELKFYLTKAGQPQYSFFSNGKSVIEPSLLGFEFEGIQKMTEGFEVIKVDKNNVDTVWH